MLATGDNTSYFPSFTCKYCDSIIEPQDLQVKVWLYCKTHAHNSSKDLYEIKFSTSELTKIHVPSIVSEMLTRPAGEPQYKGRLISNHKDNQTLI